MLRATSQLQCTVENIWVCLKMRKLPKIQWYPMVDHHCFSSMLMIKHVRMWFGGIFKHHHRSDSLQGCRENAPNKDWSPKWKHVGRLFPHFVWSGNISISMKSRFQWVESCFSSIPWCVGRNARRRLFRVPPGGDGFLHTCHPSKMVIYHSYLSLPEDNDIIDINCMYNSYNHQFEEVNQL